MLGVVIAAWIAVGNEWKSTVNTGFYEVEIRRPLVRATDPCCHGIYPTRSKGSFMD
jgi:hypothetical protein